MTRSLSLSVFLRQEPSELEAPLKAEASEAVASEKQDETAALARPDEETQEPPAPKASRPRPVRRPGARTRHSIREKGSSLIKLRSCRCCADDETAAFSHSLE
ncbi:unnamed protein product [Effrenium voratum]|nr:unnamed protein product [Effrenium voratum]